MRSDMSQLMVERPRRGGTGDAPKRIHRRHLNDPRGFDDAATHESSRRHYFDRKDLNENFAPFKRFLRSRVGDRWDDIYKDVRTCLRVDKATDLHVVGHIKDFLCTTTWRDADGDLMGHHHWGGPFRFNDKRRGNWGRAPDFYVDPDGVLRKSEPRRHRREKPARRTDVVCKDGEGAIQKDGIWYALELRRIERDEVGWGERRVVVVVDPVWGRQTRVEEGAHDVVFGNVVGRVAKKDAVEFYGVDNVVAVAVGKQLGKRALQRLGLR